MFVIIHFRLALMEILNTINATQILDWKHNRNAHLKAQFVTIPLLTTRGESEATRVSNKKTNKQKTFFNVNSSCLLELSCVKVASSWWQLKQDTQGLFFIVWVPPIHPFIHFSWPLQPVQGCSGQILAGCHRARGRAQLRHVPSPSQGPIFFFFSVQGERIVDITPYTDNTLAVI